jgi:hypothetical protein
MMTMMIIRIARTPHTTINKKESLIVKTKDMIVRILCQ